MASSEMRLVLASTFTAEPVREVLDFRDRQFVRGLSLEFAPDKQVFQKFCPTTRRRWAGTRAARTSCWCAGMICCGVRAQRAWTEWPASCWTPCELRPVRMPSLLVFARSDGSGRLDAALIEQVSDIEQRSSIGLSSEPGVRVLESAWIGRYNPVADWHDLPETYSAVPSMNLETGPELHRGK